MRKLLIGLLIVISGLFATDVNNAHFTSMVAAPDLAFDTDMQFTSDFTLRLVSGEVASGDRNNLQTGDEICSGATLRLVPTVSAKWATPDFSAVASYVDCEGAYCPAMIPEGAVTANRNIGWLSFSDWNSQKSFGDSNSWSADPARYRSLGESNFYNEPVGYQIYTGGTISSGKEGGAGMFCKGIFEVADGASVKSMTAMPSVGNVDFVVNTEGTHTISTQLSGVQCFPVVVKHPLDLPDNSGFFYMTYYTHEGPSIPATVATDTITIEVGTAGGTCSFQEQAGTIETSSSLIDKDLIMLKVAILNTGDPTLITDVSSSNPDYMVSPFPVGICETLGFPPSLCPASNGFNSQIASDASKDIHVFIRRGEGASGGTVLSVSGQTASGSCGSSALCSDSIDLTGPVNCEIEPPSIEVDTMVVAEYQVQCMDFTNAKVPCDGNNWYWSGIEGGFIERTDEFAWAYSSSPPGSSGTLNFHSRVADCKSNVTVTENGLGSEYECEFIPPSAIMNVSASGYFELNCFVNNSPDDPDNAEYVTVNGLGGSTSNSSTQGTTYTAPGAPDSGDLQAFSSWASMPGPMVGLVTLAPINVINGSNNGTNSSNNTPINPDNPGSSQWCTIGTSTLSVFPSAGGWVGIMCGPPGNLTQCTAVSWSTEGGVALSNSDTHGTEYRISRDPQTRGKIKAVVDEIPGHACWLGFIIEEPKCWEYT